MGQTQYISMVQGSTGLSDSWHLPVITKTWKQAFAKRVFLIARRTQPIPTPTAATTATATAATATATCAHANACKRNFFFAAKMRETATASTADWAAWWSANVCNQSNTAIADTCQNAGKTVAGRCQDKANKYPAIAQTQNLI